MKKRFKITSPELTTCGNYQWQVGRTQTITVPGNRLCTNEVFHYYDHPLAALWFSSINGGPSSPKLWKVAIDQMAAHDGHKGGCKVLRLVKELPLPLISLAERITICFCLADYAQYIVKLDRKAARLAANAVAAGSVFGEFFDAVDEARIAAFAALALKENDDPYEYAKAISGCTVNVTPEQGEAWMYEAFIPILESATKKKYKGES